ncbi:Nn.00g020390.m01.CDS01 [Neocucurbitaria sp. VM-36]
MPRFLQPKKSTQHRVAAIALYRALLSRCSSVSLPENDRLSLRNAIRNKFRKNRKIQSPYQLGLSFKAGYEVTQNLPRAAEPLVDNSQTLDHLDVSTTGDADNAGVLTRLIANLPRGLTRSPPLSRRRLDPPTDLPKERLSSLPSERAVLNVRPYAKTSGPRHVPILASANGVPFLRLTKPQPPALSRILRQRLERKQSLFDMMIFLANWWMPLCRQEDEWDERMNRQLMRREDGPKWVDAIQLSERENQEAYDRGLEKDREISRKMQRIVDMETELALKEGQTIVRGRKRRPVRIIKP